MTLDPKTMPEFIFLRARAIEAGAPWLALAGKLITSWPKPSTGKTRLTGKQKKILRGVTRRLAMLLSEGALDGGSVGFLWGRRKPPNHVEIEDAILDALAAPPGSTELSRRMIIDVRLDKSGIDSVKLDDDLLRQIMGSH